MATSAKLSIWLLLESCHMNIKKCCFFFLSFKWKMIFWLWDEERRTTLKVLLLNFFYLPKFRLFLLWKKNHYLYILHVKDDVFYERILVCTCEIFILWKLISWKYIILNLGGGNGRDHMVVGFTITCAISACHH